MEGSPFTWESGTWPDFNVASHPLSKEFPGSPYPTNKLYTLSQCTLCQIYHQDAYLVHFGKFEVYKTINHKCVPLSTLFGWGVVQNHASVVPKYSLATVYQTNISYKGSDTCDTPTEPPSPHHVTLILCQVQQCRRSHQCMAHAP